MTKIARKINWIIAQCTGVAVVALATNSIETAGALSSHSIVVTQSTAITMVDRSRKADRLTPLAPSVNLVLPRGCESSVSLATNLSRSDLVWRCVT
jgi:hypothetical protein